MKRIVSLISILLILLSASIFYYQVVLQGKIPIAADTIVGLYHPFRDYYAKEFPNGIPFKNFLITDPVRQQFPWRFLSVEEIKKGAMPLWNPYNGAGTPLLANFQTGALYPLTILFFIFPFTFSWTVLIMLQTVLSALFLYLYLRYMRLHQLASLFGAITFSFSGFMIAWLEWNTIAQTILWVPLLLFAKEHYLRGRGRRWILLSIFAESSLILAGHLQTAFYCLLFINIYLLARVFQLSQTSSLRETVTASLKLLTPFLFIGLTVAAITAIQWLPTIQLILQSSREVDQANWLVDGWFIPWQHLVQFLAPDFFGNPSTLNYWGVWNYGELVGYIGILPIIMALYAIGFRRDKKTAFFATLFFLSLIFSLPTLFAKVVYILNIPFLSSSQPTRLLSIADFSLAILAGLGIDMYANRKKHIFYPLFFLALCFSGLWTISTFLPGFFAMTDEQAVIARNNLKLPSILFACSLFLISLHVILKRKIFQYGILVCLVAITLFDLIRFGLKFTPFTASEYLYPKTATISFLQKDKSMFRVMATDSRLFPPNFSLMYGLSSVDLYDPLFLKRYGQLIAAMERNEPNIDPPFGFNRIITPHNVMSPLVNLLNVKYVLSLSDLDPVRYKKVFQEGNTKVFENNSYLPRAFFVKKIIPANSEKDAIAKLFNYAENLGEVAVVEGISTPQVGKAEFSIGNVTIESYTPTRVTMHVENDKAGFLVLLDTDFPSWKATLHSGTESTSLTIYKTNFAFRGVLVPQGKHTLVFSMGVM